MRNITLLCVGKLKEAYWRDACAEYEKRLGAFCKFRLVEVAEERLPDNPSSAQIAATIEAEGKRLLEQIPKDSAVIPLCIEGKELDSPALAARMQKMAVEGVSHITLIIGGSWGLSEAVKSRAALRLSMSPMTFPHQLARVMVLEQVYRAFQIVSGGKYHK
ncbi:MAG: 23S rRNA (pseudouridine(1915)-N(3))-methyltransferase RlmH [Ruminococcaceae bacterium]|nr:23S rRNA (pseudouridine(1915)-N(3))-methyltransferase RlmH [Oscillospiraceae bacterium]